MKQAARSKAVKKGAAGTKVRKHTSTSVLAASPDIVIGKKMTKTPAKPTRKGQKSLVS